MAYKALYRAYRPQTFEEVAGQRHIIQTLKNALATNKIAHAYLFCGPRGTGKTTMAKLFAKALNCEEGIGHQCNHCSNCVEIIEGTHPDVIEIDAASNNGVEEVRNLIDKVNYLPIKGRYKVYIIDEVHMMTANAFNALLKTLEEPPEHVIFILATTEPHNILPTIISRCQRYDFTKVSDADIAERMMSILSSEGITYDKAAVNAIITLADGGVRDALSILDQILAYSGNQLSEADVYKLFGLTSIAEKIDFIKAIYAGDVAKCLEKIKAFSEGGVDLKRLTNDLLEILKDILIYKKTSDYSQLTSLDELSANDLSSLIDTRSLNEMISAFLKAEIDYKTVTNIKTMFEVVVLKLATSKDGVPEQPKVVVEAPKTIEQPKPVVQEVVKEPETVVEKVKQPEPIKEEIKVEEPKLEEPKPAAPDWLFEDEKVEESPKVAIENEGERYEFDDDLIMKIMVIGDKDERISIMKRWDELTTYLGHPTLGDVVALLKDGRPFIVSKQFVVLTYDFSKMADRLNIKSNSKLASEVLSKMLNREVFAYAISHSESTRLIKAFHNLRQVGKLPKSTEIEIDLEEIK